MRITVLGSGSQGNATLVEAKGTRVLIDAGLSARTIRRRMKAALGTAPERLDGVLLTHAHGDHVGHAERVARVFGEAPIWLTESTRRALRFEGTPRTRVYGPRASFRIGALEVHPIGVPHDAPQVGLVLEGEGERAGLVTDLGTVPDALVDHLRGCRRVLIESNYDAHMLEVGPYPVRLRERIASDVGHLDNAETARLLRRLSPTTDTIVLMHLSRKNNTPAQARAVAAAALGTRGVRLEARRPDGPTRARPTARAPARLRVLTHARIRVSCLGRVDGGARLRLASLRFGA